ncbi:MAG: hypothetical protein AAF591_01310 [Verrucomicrobiota bacterium]
MTSPLPAILLTLSLFSIPATVAAAEKSYGTSLDSIAHADLGPAADVFVRNNRAYVAGTESLHILDITNADAPQPVGKLSGLGGVRQLVVSGDHAYVTSREQGLFIVDISDEQNPRLAKHYETIEFATGIAISGNILFVACRHYGVEIIDVSAPDSPVHLSTVRTGEAQSVAVRDDLLFTGVWASSEVVIVDVSNPRKPTIISKVPLDGYGDGVDVAGDFLYAATGHHSKDRPKKNPGDPGFGHGHGLEIINIANPKNPEFVSRIKFPPFYDRGKDTWRVTIANNHAFVSDTYNGVFVVDVKDPANPKTVAHYKLPISPKTDIPGPVGGLAPINDRILVAGSETDLHIVSAPNLAKPVVHRKQPAKPIPPREESSLANGYAPNGQVHAVAFLEDDLAVLACGVDGVHVVQLWPEIKPITTLKTGGFTTDLAVQNNTVLVAEGRGGLSVCKWSPDTQKLTRLSNYREGDRPIRQVEWPPGPHALVQEGAGTFKIINLDEPANPELVLTDSHPGLLYGDQTMQGLTDENLACIFWHVSGLHWYDLSPGKKPTYTGDNFPGRTGSPNGLVALGDKTLTTTRGGYLLLDPSERRPLEELNVIKALDSNDHLGTPTLFDNLLIAAHRAYGTITVVDISDPMAPKQLDRFTITGNPGRVHLRNNHLVIPGGHDGLILKKLPPTSAPPSS